jgi:type VI secretion system VasD/TssJ family lipoprotein
MNKKKALIPIKILLLILPLFFLLSCASKKPEFPDPKWKFEKNAIEIRYSSSKNLNLFNENPHTLVAGIFQLAQKAEFEEISNTSQGLKELLSIKNISDKNSLKIKDCLKYLPVIISPDENKTITIDREENTRWIGIIAGYYSLDPKNSVRIYEIPIINETEKKFFKKKYKSYPSQIFININFGSHSITNLETD